MGLPPAPAIPLDKVEWRVDGRPVERDGGFRCRFVPYFDARDAEDLLDGWVGAENWKNTETPFLLGTNPGMLCVLSVRVGDEWVGKSDVGVPTQFEPVKGATSDSFKRACVMWGVGRNVYDLPTLWAPCDTYTANGKVQAKPNQKSLPSILAQLSKAGFAASGGRVEQDATQQGAGVDGAVSDGDAGQTGDGADSHDVGRSVPEPAPDLCPGCSKPAKGGQVLKPGRVDGLLWHKTCWDRRPM